MATVSLDRIRQTATFCNTGQLVFHKNAVWTGGPSTCIVFMARTRGSVVCWHFSAADVLDADKMEHVRKQLAGLQPRGAAYFLIPGVDRDPQTWDLKPDCRSMALRPDNDPTASRKDFFEFVRQFEWYDKVQFLPAPAHYKEFIVLRRKDERPVYVRDDVTFDATCVADAAYMT